MKIKRLKDGQLRYEYEATPGMGFSLSLLCEVGDPWLHDARRELAKLESRGYTIEFARSIDEKPYCSDFAIKGAQP